MRRVAVLTVLSAVGLALLAPLTARSAVPDAVLAAADPLLAAPPEARGDLARGSLVDRSSTSRLVLATGPQVSGIELIAATALPTPAVAPMEATLYPSSAPAPPASATRVVAAPAATTAPTPSGDTVTGSATWYCCSLGYRGEAVVALPGALGGGYDAPPAARSVTVCADRCVVLPVVDYCDCLWGTSGQKVADLSPEAWAAVTDRSLDAGVVTVTVQLGG
jgi:hypothetical protein